MKYTLQILFLLLINISCIPSSQRETSEAKAAQDVLSRALGPENASNFIFNFTRKDTLDTYSVQVENNKIVVTGTSPTALTRGAYDYLKNATHSIVSWSGNKVHIPEILPKYNKTTTTPFKYRYYLNTVTHGYTTPYWDWERWEKELDWMALHGMNMPIIAGAHEAILLRTFKKLGLTEEEALEYFSGPAHFPWNRMGNIGNWDGPPPLSFFEKQIGLAHKMQDRMKELDMHPIVHAFAGFVPKGLQRIYPNEELRELGWGGFDEKVQILSPKSELFKKIGKLYIQEWENEFGKGEFYLADSFNEMDVPLSDDPEMANEELASYGKAVYEPIAEANPEAVWVMQGWTFPYHRDKKGNLFWTPERLKAMMSGIPDDKLLILDMANEYNALYWKIPYSWEMYDGFFGKQWIYSFIPNMGGKVPLNGVLDFYAEAPEEAINFKGKKNLVGFGFAPEGIENNEIIYELLADWGWREKAINLDEWIKNYCLDRYGKYPESLKGAYNLLRKSALGTFTDHPRFKYQFRPDQGSATVHNSGDFLEAAKLFLEASNDIDDKELYNYDAIEIGAQAIGLKIDSLFNEAEGETNENLKYQTYQNAIDLMLKLDRVLASHSKHKLSNWVDLARNFGDTPEEKLYYESNAKRLITTWGGGVNEYAARTWSGLIGDYYAQRWQLWLDANKHGKDFDTLKWEEGWITSEWKNNTVPYEDPIAEIKAILLNSK
ncbi:alpha-N-acetylglucosaminidase [Arenibacter sp. N53]|uniref:alpha-N-acetylglucosaminidase n=1 Tax=Arenibacter TaxID=178469 RepID=UPI000CD419FF|nr:MULTISPECIES: alpha-N-acetylglucosaminidase [Arenibacter]MCM4149962.1 alpha-N-acetylglucosaminidase [Arenibacter sp. N53]